MTELKPCPFCGGEPTLDEGEAFEVMCRKCFRAGTVIYSTRSEAIEAWNTRYEPTWGDLGKMLDRAVRAETRLLEIVRCKDCVHYADHEWITSPQYGLGTDIEHVCHFWHGKPTKVEPDGFCAWGERTPND